MNTSDSNFFGTEKVSRILLKIAPPVMLAQLIQALYNIVDSLFVGKYSESGLTALSIIYPLQLLMIAIAVGTGVGINTAMAHYLGVHDEKKANCILHNVDWDGNELLLSDILGTDEDIIYRDLEDETERKLLNAAIDRLNPREQKIVKLRFGLGREQEDEMTQKEVADLLGISQSYISRLEKKIMKRLKKEISQQCGLYTSR